MTNDHQSRANIPSEGKEENIKKIASELPKS